MTMIFNGTELEEVRFNGVDCEKVYMNGVLVFEKAAGATITVITREDAEDIQEWGSSFGNTQIPPLGIIILLTWGWNVEPSNGWVRLHCTNTSHTGRVRVTIGGIVRVLNKNTAGGNWGLTQTPAQYNELPKSGTHTLKIEAIP